MIKKHNIQAFFALIRAGFFPVHGERLTVNDTLFKDVDWNEVYQLAQEQSLQGLVLQGIDAIHGSWLKVHGSSLVPQELLLEWIGEVQMIELRNKEMNAFIAELVGRMREKSIYTLLVKGQGIAQCYKRPLWRVSGDIDLLLGNNDNYEKAKEFLIPLSSSQKIEEQYSKHLGLSIGEWYVEIHGSLRSGLSESVDREIDVVQRSIFFDGKVRSWMNGETEVFLPAATEDVFLVFTHFIKHFYKEGLGLRQVCDWCRLLWTYKESLNHGLLEKRIRRSGLMSEWKGFAAVAVEYLGMDAKAMPLFNKNDNENEKFKRKAEKIVKLILSGYTGNKYKDTLRIVRIYPWNTLKFLPGILFHLNWLKIKERLF